MARFPCLENFIEEFPERNTRIYEAFSIYLRILIIIRILCRVLCILGTGSTALPTLTAQSIKTLENSQFLPEVGTSMEECMGTL